MRTKPSSPTGSTRSMGSTIFNGRTRHNETHSARNIGNHVKMAPPRHAGLRRAVNHHDVAAKASFDPLNAITVDGCGAEMHGLEGCKGKGTGLFLEADQLQSLRWRGQYGIDVMGVYQPEHRLRYGRGEADRAAFVQCLISPAKAPGVRDLGNYENALVIRESRIEGNATRSCQLLSGIHDFGPSGRSRRAPAIFPLFALGCGSKPSRFPAPIP